MCAHLHASLSQEQGAWPAEQTQRGPTGVAVRFDTALKKLWPGMPLSRAKDQHTLWQPCHPAWERLPRRVAPQQLASWLWALMQTCMFPHLEFDVTEVARQLCGHELVSPSSSSHCGMRQDWQVHIVQGASHKNMAIRLKARQMSAPVQLLNLRTAGLWHQVSAGCARGRPSVRLAWPQRCPHRSEQPRCPLRCP